jgi:hypothetical protein
METVMSVIAKMVIRQVHQFGVGNLVELSCLCSNDMMTAYAGSEEDKLFTKYSPNGDIKLHQPHGFTLGEQNDVFFVMIGRTAEVDPDSFGKPGPDSPYAAYAWGTLRVISMTLFGGESRRVEMCDGYRKLEHFKPRGMDNFNWKMSIDNPAATNQLTPGLDDYFIAFYPEKHFTRDDAIRAFHHASE